MTVRKVLVVGATGKQGSAFVRAALAANASASTDSSSPSSTDTLPPFHLIALTRNAASPAGKGLAGLGEHVTVATADLNTPETVRKVFEDEKAKSDGAVWGVFIALAFPGLGADASGEERQGKLVVDLAHEYGVQELIYSSAERGHHSRDADATSSGQAKTAIEAQIKAKQGLRWTIIRPAFFMENFDGTLGRVTVSVLRVGLKKDTKLQLVAADDIGAVAVAIMKQPDAYAGQELSVVGDALTMDELQDAYKRGAGHALPAMPNLVARGIVAMNKHVKALHAEIEQTYADNVTQGVSLEDRIACCRALHPAMHTVESWARTPRADADWAPGWNGVKLADLLAGKV